MLRTLYGVLYWLLTFKWPYPIYRNIRFGHRWGSWEDYEDNMFQQIKYCKKCGKSYVGSKTCLKDYSRENYSSSLTYCYTERVDVNDHTNGE